MAWCRTRSTSRRAKWASCSGSALSVAAQAMQLLVDEEKLVRRDRSGTFVGPARGARSCVA